MLEEGRSMKIFFVAYLIAAFILSLSFVLFNKKTLLTMNIREIFLVFIFSPLLAIREFFEWIIKRRSK